MSEITVISLTSNRNERWIYHHYRIVHSTEDTRSIIYSADGNVYIAGFTVDTNWVQKFSVISLTSGGSERWVYRYSPPDIWGSVNSLVNGADGNIYAGGTTYNDFTVISLTPNGNERWVYQYNRPGNNWGQALSIVYGADGNIYAGGESYDSITKLDITVISLTSNGAQRWIYRHNGSGNDDDRAYSLIYGADGNIYAGGLSYDSITGSDFTVISLTPDGTQRWIYQYNGSGNWNDGAISLVFGSDGNIYAGGWSYDSITGSDFTVISLTPNGTERWVYRYNGPSNLSDGALSIAYGADGNIYAGGESYDNITGSDFIVISLTVDGIERWVYRYNGPGNDYDVANSLVYGTDGNIYAAGESWGVSSHNDFIVISINPAIGINEKYTSNRSPLTAFRISIGTIQSNNLTYSLSLFEPSTVSLSLYNISGQMIISWKISAYHGTSKHVKDLPNLGLGVYFLKAEVLGKEYKDNKKLIIVR